MYLFGWNLGKTRMQFLRKHELDLTRKNSKKKRVLSFLQAK